jgi:hypothetical protein
MKLEGTFILEMGVETKISLREYFNDPWEDRDANGGYTFIAQKIIYQDYA